MTNSSTAPLALRFAPLASALLAAVGLASGTTGEDPERAWTVLIYGGCDNSSEDSFCPDMGNLMRGMQVGDEGAESIEVLCSVDRSPGLFGRSWRLRDELQ